MSFLHHNFLTVVPYAGTLAGLSLHPSLGPSLDGVLPPRWVTQGKQLGLLGSAPCPVWSVPSTGRQHMFRTALTAEETMGSPHPVYQCLHGESV